ncbi:hypothetical protein MED01_002466 [Micromonospora sp. MED01]|uniref:hypothetical protein n=1 Tax=Micromonospora alfalfae TaxID=2911212 RepID=UPI001EE81905|nr:hypothetical protein [Micromonospora alfalfae]MCG5464300.1 hypothetical protein [Micromonospora alfalfae]
MSRHPAAALLAMPGDLGLDADVDGLTVTRFGVDANTCTVAVNLVDGFGRFIDAAGAAHTVPPGDPETRANLASIAAWLPDATPVAWSEYVTTLRRWWETGTPVRLCAAPGRITVLIEDRNVFLLFPRRTDPEATP